MDSKLILGTVQFGLNYGINNSLGQLPKTSIFEILDYAYANGIKILDTAESYGNSQEIIGEFIKSNPKKKFKIITKLSASKDISKIKLDKVVEENCKILGVDNLHGYMIHDLSALIRNTFLYEKLLSVKKTNNVEKIGISLYTNDEIEYIFKNYPGFDFIQIPFNLLDNESKRKKTIMFARSIGIEIHVRSIFLQGLFFKPINKFYTTLHPLIKHLNNLNSISKNMSLEIGNLAIKYPLSKKYIDHILIGVDSLDQLKNNIINCDSIKDYSFKKVDNIDVKEDFLLHPKNWIQ